MTCKVFPGLGIKGRRSVVVIRDLTVSLVVSDNSINI